MKTVLTHGVFDVLHIGHIRLLRQAHQLGDALVVSLLADKWVKLYKRFDRPIHSLDERIEQMRAIRYVDEIVVVDGAGHEAVQEMIEMVRPDIYVKGLASKGTFKEEDWVRSQGIQMMFVDMAKIEGEDMSSSRILQVLS